MDRKIIKILLIVVTVISVGFIVIAIVGYLTPDTLVKNPGVPKSRSARVITIEEETPGYKIATNKYDGYQITVPSNWLVANTAGKTGGMKIYFEEGASEAPLEIDSGLLLNVLTLDDPRDIEIYIPADAEFSEIEINGESVFMSRYKALEEVGFDEEFNVIEEAIEDSQVTAYIFRGGGKTYLVTCTAIAANFSELATLCEEQVQTFAITN